MLHLVDPPKMPATVLTLSSLRARLDKTVDHARPCDFYQPSGIYA